MRVGLDDFNDIPSLGDVDEHGDAIRFVSLDEFVATEEPASEPLLGTAQETILPMNGMLLMYGDGGAGKTTLSIDAVAHLSSGTSWLGIEVERPLKITLIENEGPRAKFRQALDEKTRSWNGHVPFRQNVNVLEEPWTRFSLQNEYHRQALAIHVSRSESDLVVMGPLVTLGMVGGGTPDEISTFEKLLTATRQVISRPFSFWIVHHENKAGDVSGAWERVPDTLCHVQARGNGHTALHWRKARWSSERHGTTLDLTWEPGRSFSINEPDERDPYADMLEAFRKDDEWRTAKESGKLIELAEAQAKKVLAELVRRGHMVYEQGPSGRHKTAHCWRLKGALMDLAHLGAPSLPEQSEEKVRGCAPPVRGAAPRSAPTTPEVAALAEASAPSSPDDEDLPF